jgi:outer membrane protein TolC
MKSGSIVNVLRAVYRAACSLIALALCCALPHLAAAQQQPLTSNSTVSQGATAQAQTPLNLGISQSPGATQDPFSGSVISGKVSTEIITLTLKDAINRGLKQNLGALLTEQGITSARAQRWRALQEVLPDVTGRIGESEQQINLAAQGIKFPGIPTIIGPFSNFDARAYLTTTIGFSQYESIRSAIENLKAANFSYQNALELVVFSVSNAYLQVLTSGANVINAEAQVNTARALVNQAEQMHQAGVTAKIDGLRATVELQARKQDLVVARNNLEKSKIALARTIGLPLEQQFQLADTLQYLPAPVLTQEDAIHHAYQTRLDYRQAEAQVRAAQLSERGAHSERLPSLFISGNYGDLGITPGSSHGTFVAAGGVQFPIFEEGRIRADIYQAQSTLKQSKDQLADLQGRIDAEIRTAFLDVNAAAERVELAGSTVKLSQEELAEAQDRFAAGVTDNLEVVQAEGSLVNAQNQYVSSLYIHNLAKLSLARAMGEARQNAVSYLGGK